jgi:hypothetical protein
LRASRTSKLLCRTSELLCWHQNCSVAHQSCSLRHRNCSVEDRNCSVGHKNCSVGYLYCVVGHQNLKLCTYVTKLLTDVLNLVRDPRIATMPRRQRSTCCDHALPPTLDRSITTRRCLEHMPSAPPPHALSALPPHVLSAELKKDLPCFFPPSFLGFPPPGGDPAGESNSTYRYRA